MKRLAFSIIVTLIIFGLIVGAGNAQNRRRRSRPKPQMARTASLTEASNPSLSEENAEILQACSLPDRPRPEAVIKTPVLCGKAISLPKPSYPEEAKAAKVYGLVAVDIVIDERGRVIWAKATSGDPLLRNAAAKAACRARYSPIKVSGQAVKANSVITYNFVLQ